MSVSSSSDPDTNPCADNAGWSLEHSYFELPALFHTSVSPTPVKAPRLVVFNRPLALSLGLNPDHLTFTGETAAALFAGNSLPPGAAPLAQAYAGHQFGHFTTLGDGRAILLGEQITPDGHRFDIQLKGPGPTPYSRRGDGRAALGPMLREYIISEALHHLGIPTTRSLAVTATGETVWRQDPLSGAVLTRVAASHIRVGTFEWAAANQNEAALQKLVEYTLRRHYPEHVDAPNQALALLECVIEKQASLLAQWMLVGFIHGVMNTDNMTLSGETIDYGPCAFLDSYDPSTVFSSIDRNGRYAYANQPPIAQWNLTRLAESLLPLFGADEKTAIELAENALAKYAPRYQSHWLSGMRKKLGLFTETPEDRELIDSLLEWMRSTKADFTNTFASLVPDSFGETTRSTDPTFMAWQTRWKTRLENQPQTARESGELRRKSNPAFIPRNHLVEAALSAAQDGDIGGVERLLEVISSPYDHSRHAPEYSSPAPTGSPRYQTFCGT